MKVILIVYLQVFSALLPNASDTLRMFFLGDIMQHAAQLNAAYSKTGDKDHSSSYNYDSYFTHLTPFFSKADIVGANMETTFGPPPFTGYPSFCSPSSLAFSAQKSGINIFFGSNNHSVDKGSAGLRGTIDLYKQMGINYTGIYSNEGEELETHPLLVTVRNFRIAFLNYTYGTNGIPVPKPYIVKLLDENVIKTDLQKARQLNPHLIIIAVHWGDEYKLTPSAGQIKWEKIFYDNGADIIIGSHPHVPQPVVTHKDINGAIRHITAFSLGNAISNMTAQNTRIGLMLEINYVRHITGESEILNPVIHHIWTSRPAATGGNYTIVPIKDYLDSAGKYNIRGEKELIERYYSKFVKND